MVDLTQEELVERASTLRNKLASGSLGKDAALVDYAILVDHQATYAARAKAEGRREGIEMAATKIENDDPFWADVIRAIDVGAG
jgi:hypothetical protein